jgi:general secretion pathway protein D
MTRGCRSAVLASLFVVLLTPTARGQEPLRIVDGAVMLDFQDADLRLVLAALADAGALNVIHGELPERRVTLRTTQPVTLDEIPALIRSLAAANGLVVVVEGTFIRLEAAGPALDPDPQPAQEEEVHLHVYRLRHAQAIRLAGTLQTLFGASRTQGSAASPPRTSLSQRLRDQRIPPVEVTEEVAAPPPADITRDPGTLSAEIRGDLQIVPDEATNSLLVRAQPSDWAVVEQAIQALDLRPLQVLIEVVIAEVRRSDDLNVGVSGRITDGRREDRPAGAELEGVDPEGFSMRLGLRGDVDVDVALSALSSTGRVRILSRPVILAQNNEEARILVGAERPFVQVFRSLPTDGAIRDQIVQYRDVGTSLTILPTINPDGYVNLQLTQEVSTATAETQFGAPVISTREAATRLLARDGQTVVIGGLIDRQRDWTRSGIPVLKDIPVLGALFGSTRAIDGNSELFLFLTPHLVETDADADRIREEIQRSGQLEQELGPVLPILPPRPRTPPDTIGLRPGGSR